MNLSKRISILLCTAIVSIAVLESCDKEIKFQEDTLGPYVVVCVESYKPYTETFNLIDSLKNELKAIDVKTEKDFGIFYERTADRTPDKYHSIVGCILPTNTDTTEIIKLERNKFTVRNIGATKSMHTRIPFQDFNSTLRVDVLKAIDDYILQNNYLPIPNGINGIMEIYEDDHIVFSAEIRPSR
ncbi:MAG: hypothetical protein J5882_03020 [Bacteroidales bacterium]|nr:hypothetical protein [Bacteroidales bacterium]